MLPAHQEVRTSVLRLLWYDCVYGQNWKIAGMA